MTPIISNRILSKPQQDQLDKAMEQFQKDLGRYVEPEVEGPDVAHYLMRVAQWDKEGEYSMIVFGVMEFDAPEIIAAIKEKGYNVEAKQYWSMVSIHVTRA